MVGLPEFVVLISVVVIVFSWRKFPQMGSSIRKSLLGFKAGIKGEDEKERIRDVEEYEEKPPLPPKS